MSFASFQLAAPTLSPGMLSTDLTSCSASLYLHVIGSTDRPRDSPILVTRHRAGDERERERGARRTHRSTASNACARRTIALTFSGSTSSTWEQSSIVPSKFESCL